MSSPFALGVEHDKREKALRSQCAFNFGIKDEFERWRRQTARPAADWLHVRRPNHASSATICRRRPTRGWTAQDALLKVTGGRFGKRVRDVESNYLLTGFARCDTCGGALGVISRRTTGTKRSCCYGCITYDKRGATCVPTVC
jgi:hypothetical protein